MGFRVALRGSRVKGSFCADQNVAFSRGTSRWDIGHLVMAACVVEKSKREGKL